MTPETSCQLLMLPQPSPAVQSSHSRCLLFSFPIQFYLRLELPKQVIQIIMTFTRNIQLMTSSASVLVPGKRHLHTAPITRALNDISPAHSFSCSRDQDQSFLLLWVSSSPSPLQLSLPLHLPPLSLSPDLLVTSLFPNPRFLYSSPNAFEPL